MKSGFNLADQGFFILIAVLTGVNYFLNKIENMPLKVTLMIVVNIIILIIFFSIMIKLKNCPFHNDKRLFYGKGANPDIWFSDAHFCSVADPIKVSFEVVNGEKRYISNTNQFLSCCLNKGEGCPIFQKFNMMSKDKLMEFYEKKWNQEMLHIGG